MALVVKCNNGIVTDEYLELIGDTFKKLGCTVDYVNGFSNIPPKSKDEIIVVARTIEAFKALMKGHRKIVMWFQGIEPEESYMSHHSEVRFFLLSVMEKMILKRAKFCFFVSEEMVRHYEEKYKLKLDREKMYIMPCQNTDFHPEAFLPREKYQNNYFAYTGSLAIWQKFEDTVIAYKVVEDSGLPNCKFLVFTSEKNKAEQILRKYNVNNYSIDFVNPDDLPKALNCAKYGFIIREDTPVNRVATPTKISTYMACGLIPIYSKCLTAFADIAESMKYVVCYDDNYLDSIRLLSNTAINNDEVRTEYDKVFRAYFDKTNHQKKLLEKLKTFAQASV